LKFTLDEIPVKSQHVMEYITFVRKGLSVKDIRSQGGCSVRTRGVLQMQTSALFSEKNFGFFEIYGVYGQRW